MRGLPANFSGLWSNRLGISAIEFALTLSVILGLLFVSVRVMTMAPIIFASPPAAPAPPAVETEVQAQMETKTERSP